MVDVGREYEVVIMRLGMGRLAVASVEDCR